MMVMNDGKLLVANGTRKKWENQAATEPLRVEGGGPAARAARPHSVNPEGMMKLTWTARNNDCKKRKEILNPSVDEVSDSLDLTRFRRNGCNDSTSLTYQSRTQDSSPSRCSGAVVTRKQVGGGKIQRPIRSMIIKWKWKDHLMYA